MFVNTGFGANAKKEMGMKSLNIMDYDRSNLCFRSSCEYLHQYDMTRMPLCHFFVEGHCTKDDCQFLHIRPEDSAADCPWYARGFCKHGPKCRKKHTRKELCGSYMAGFCPKGPCNTPIAASTPFPPALVILFCPSLSKTSLSLYLIRPGLSGCWANSVSAGARQVGPS
jgi:hypothetical protein